MSDDEDDVYDYSLIQFVHRGQKRKIEEVDIIPSKWLSFDNKKSKFVTKFMPPPYDGENGEVLHSFIQTLADAPENWPIYTVRMKGRAKTYADALIKIERLKTEESVLTVDSGESVSEVEKRIEIALRQQKLRQKQKLLELSLNDDSEGKDQADTKKHSQVQNKIGPTASTSKQCQDSSKGNFVETNMIYLIYEYMLK